MAAEKAKHLHGVFAINKPFGMSSAQVIRDCQNIFHTSQCFKPMLEEDAALRALESNRAKSRRRGFKKEIRVKMGHGGTLDPLATGVLILGTGRGTKHLQQFLGCTKTYETIVLFGASTDTYDRTGRILKKGNYDDITREATEKALESFRGKIKQMPPLYSALKMNGKPLYEYAREGKPIPREIETREVEVSELELVEWYEPGTHNHRWPTEEAEQAEKNLVESVWRVAKQQEASGEEPGKLTPAQQEEETQALAEYNTKKREAEERVDKLVSDEQPSKKRKKANDGRPEPMMSGALGELPPAGKGSNLIPPSPSPDTPPPWEGRGPPAAKIRMTVSSGFYVRSLCHDLGEKLGCGGMMAELCRTRQNDYVLGKNCLEYNDLLKGEDVWAPRLLELLGIPGEKQQTVRQTSPPGATAKDSVEQGKAKEETTTADDAPTKTEEAAPVPAAAST
ncbi:hypothetical protein VTK26DRAFT_755 [Humicola hyalothermophila]